MTLNVEKPWLITLGCGHRFKARFRPGKHFVTYPCHMKTGCGYAQPWVYYQDMGGFTTHNERLTPT